MLINVLLVEDNPGDRRLIQEALKATSINGFSLECADRLSAGLEKLSARKPDAVILDLALPDSQGLDTFSSVYAQAPDVPIVVLTGLKDEQLAVQAVRAGAQDYLVKNEAAGGTLVRSLLYAIERHRAEAARGRLAAIVESADEAILGASCEGVIQSWNRGAERLYGYTASEIIGRSASLLVPPDRMNEAASLLDRTNRGERIEHYETIRVRKDGRLIDISVMLSPIMGASGRVRGVSAIARDITETKKAQMAVQRERQRLLDVLETLPAMICLLTPDYHVPFANRSFRQRFGESNGRRCYEYCWKRTTPCEFCESFEALKTGQPHHWEVNAPDGTVIDAYDFPFADADGSLLVLEMDMDITERKRMEEELRQLPVHLLEAQEEERRRIARELHDSTVQNLAAIKLNLSLVEQSTPLPNAAQELLAETSALAGQCFNELHDVSYLLHPPLLDDLGLTTTLEHFVDGYQRRSGISVALDIVPDLGRLPRDMEIALFRVAQECLINVHRHSGSSTASVRIARDSAGISLEVSDSGRGAPERSTEKGKERTPGHGVGIQGMRERVKALGGRFEFHSGTGGTTVRVQLPFLKAQSKSSSPTAS